MAHGLYTLSKPSKKVKYCVFVSNIIQKSKHKGRKGKWRKIVHPGKAFLISYLQNVATLNEAGISTPTGSVLCTVHHTPARPPLAGLPPELRAGLRLWSQTGVSCKPLCHLVTWYRGSAVPGWSSSCQIFSYSSFSSSFCG